MYIRKGTPNNSIAIPHHWRTNKHIVFSWEMWQYDKEYLPNGGTLPCFWWEYHQETVIRYTGLSAQCLGYQLAMMCFVLKRFFFLEEHLSAFTWGIISSWMESNLHSYSLPSFSFTGNDKWFPMQLVFRQAVFCSSRLNVFLKSKDSISCVEVLIECAVCHGWVVLVFANSRFKAMKIGQL